MGGWPGWLRSTHRPTPKLRGSTPDQAAKLDPLNSKVRLFRGQILEGVGKQAEAQIEFQSAFAANTNSSYFRDQPGEFFRRNGGSRRSIHAVVRFVKIVRLSPVQNRIGRWNKSGLTAIHQKLHLGLAFSGSVR